MAVAAASVFLSELDRRWCVKKLPHCMETAMNATIMRLGPVPCNQIPDQSAAFQCAGVLHCHAALSHRRFANSGDLLDARKAGLAHSVLCVSLLLPCAPARVTESRARVEWSDGLDFDLVRHPDSLHHRVRPYLAAHFRSRKSAIAKGEGETRTGGKTRRTPPTSN